MKQNPVTELNWTAVCLFPSFRWYQFMLLRDRDTWVWTTCLQL